MTESDARKLATPDEPFTYVLNLRLSDPAAAGGFANAYNSRFAGNSMGPQSYSWQSLRTEDGAGLSNERQVLSVGSSLLGLLAIATVVVLVGGRMAAQTRRVGLLKAVGAGPPLIAMLLLAENLFLALVAAGLGLLAGLLLAPAFVSPGEGLVGAAGGASITPATAGLVVA